MNRIAVIIIIASLASASDAFAMAPGMGPLVGEQHEIVVSYETSAEGSDGSSSSSRGTNVVLERVISSGEQGLELEFDLSQTATPEERAREWKYPVRVLQPPNGAIRLLNRAELEQRVDGWLAAAELTRQMCGRWIFTWNAFRIECEPESVIADIEAINLLSADISEGAEYRYPQTPGAGNLVRKSDGPEGSTFLVTLPVDVNAIRKLRAESDVVVGEMMRQPVTLEAALRERSKEAVTGTVEITIDVDVTGSPVRRTVVTKLQTIEPDGVSKTDIKTVKIERRIVPGRVEN